MNNNEKQELKEEIKSLKTNLRKTRARNTKKGIVRSIRVGGKVIEQVIPYLVAAGVLTGAFLFLGDVPYYRNNEKRYHNIRTDMDTYGNVSYEEQYGYFENVSDQLYYFDKWKQNEDGSYSRDVKSYVITKKNYDEVLKIFSKNNIEFSDTKSIEDFLNNPKNISKETKSNLPEEELMKDAYFQISTYDKNKNEYRVAKQSVDDNIGYSIIFTVMLIVLEIAMGRLKRSEYSCIEEEVKLAIGKGYSKYPPENTEELVSVLKLKKEELKNF